jgi:hypothetical protein
MVFMSCEPGPITQSPINVDTTESTQTIGAPLNTSKCIISHLLDVLFSAVVTSALTHGEAMSVPLAGTCWDAELHDIAQWLPSRRKPRFLRLQHVVTPVNSFCDAPLRGRKKIEAKSVVKLPKAGTLRI